MEHVKMKPLEDDDVPVEPVVFALANRLSAFADLEDGRLRWELHDQDTGEVVLDGIATSGQWGYEEMPESPSCLCPNCVSEKVRERYAEELNELRKEKEHYK
jgi:hypothetical protein